MKTLLNLVPRPWLIQLSIWFRPLIKLYFKGNRFTDPIDGISYRKFIRKYTLADDIVVTGAKLENGLLLIELEQIVPEEMKPKLIEIK